MNADTYKPCLPPGGIARPCTAISSRRSRNRPERCAGAKGFAAQLGFRLPNLVISPFTRKHYVSHMPMDHTAVIKFVESRFIGTGAHLTNRDAAQPNLLDFFDFTECPWSTPPTIRLCRTPPGKCTPRRCN